MPIAWSRRPASASARNVLRKAGSLRVASCLPYVSTSAHPVVPASCARARELVLEAKEGSRTATEACAVLLSRHPALRGFSGAVIPAPRSEAGRPSLLQLAQALVRHGVGRVALPLLHRVRSVPSSRMLRRRGLPGVSLEEHRRSIVAEVTDLDPRTPILLVDDMFTEGTTLRACAAVLREDGFTGPILGATAGYFVDICPDTRARARAKGSR